MDELSAKITADGEAEAKAFHDYFEWCDDVSKNTNFDITTAKTAIGKLEAHIAELSSNIEVSTSKIEELAADIAENSAELKSATEIRDKEAADFAASEKELVDTVDTLDRAVSILNREMAKKSSSPRATRQHQLVEHVAVAECCG
jgi:chromosome segregation ATPase